MVTMRLLLCALLASAAWAQKQPFDVATLMKLSRISEPQLSPDGNVWGATVNKTSGDAQRLDDVVFPLFPSGGGFPRSNADNT